MRNYLVVYEDIVDKPHFVHCIAKSPEHAKKQVSRMALCKKVISVYTKVL